MSWPLADSICSCSDTTDALEYREVAVELDLYLPSLSGGYFVGDGRPARGHWQVRNPGDVLVTKDGRELTTVPPFESVDYVWGVAGDQPRF